MNSQDTGIPLECTALNDNGLYYNIEPREGGNINIELYTDDTCTTVYTGNSASAETFVPTDTVSQWNNAMDALKVCQPCVTYDLIPYIRKNIQVNTDGNRYSSYGGDNTENDSSDDDVNANNNNNGEGDAFVCRPGGNNVGDNGDDNNANNNNNNIVNQCSMFRNNNDIFVASYQDIMLAESQGTVVGLQVGNHMLGTPYSTKKISWLSILFFLGSFGLLIYGKLPQVCMCTCVMCVMCA
jgi:hypothetical protein